MISGVPLNRSATFPILSGEMQVCLSSCFFLNYEAATLASLVNEAKSAFEITGAARSKVTLVNWSKTARFFAVAWRRTPVSAHTVRSTDAPTPAQDGCARDHFGRGYGVQGSHIPSQFVITMMLNPKETRNRSQNLINHSRLRILRIMPFQRRSPKSLQTSDQLLGSAVRAPARKLPLPGTCRACRADEVGIHRSPRCLRASSFFSAARSSCNCFKITAALGLSVKQSHS